MVELLSVADAFKLKDVSVVIGTPGSYADPDSVIAGGVVSIFSMEVSGVLGLPTMSVALAVRFVTPSGSVNEYGSLAAGGHALPL
jgi:hypothetical protein